MEEMLKADGNFVFNGNRQCGKTEMLARVLSEKLEKENVWTITINRTAMKDLYDRVEKYLTVRGIKYERTPTMIIVYDDEKFYSLRDTRDFERGYTYENSKTIAIDDITHNTMFEINQARKHLRREDFNYLAFTTGGSYSFIEFIKEEGYKFFEVKL